MLRLSYEGAAKPFALGFKLLTQQQQQQQEHTLQSTATRIINTLSLGYWPGQFGSVRFGWDFMASEHKTTSKRRNIKAHTTLSMSI